MANNSSNDSFITVEATFTYFSLLSTLFILLPVFIVNILATIGGYNHREDNISNSEINPC